MLCNGKTIFANNHKHNTIAHYICFTDINLYDAHLTMAVIHQLTQLKAKYKRCTESNNVYILAIANISIDVV